MGGVDLRDGSAFLVPLAVYIGHGYRYLFKGSRSFGKIIRLREGIIGLVMLIAG